MSFVIERSPPSAETLAIARDELRETPEVVKEAIEELRKLVEADESIYFATDDDTLTIFLRPCKWYAKSAHDLMKRIAQFKVDHKDVLDNLLPKDEEEAFLHHNVVNVLKNRDHKGRRVLLVNCGGSWDCSKVTPNQLFRLFYLIHEAAVLEPETQIRGVVVIMDYDNLGMKQVKSLSPSFALLLLGFIQKAMPLRLKEVHIVKQPFIFNMVWTLFKPFIKEKLNKRIFFHGSKMKSLHAHLAPSHLPKDYDGELPAIDYGGKEWYPTITNCTEHIKKWNEFGMKKK